MTAKLHFVKTDGETDKTSLRSYAKDRRSHNENRDMKEVLLIANTLTLLNELKSERAGTGTRLKVFVYLSYSSEAPTDNLIEALQENGFKVFCPRVAGKRLQAVALSDDFTVSERGIREPTGKETDEKMDFVVTPLLAADKRGNRLGYGGGYYDRYFAENENAVRIGYCYDFQIMKSVPHTEKDIPLHYIVTDKQVIKTEENRK